MINNDIEFKATQERVARLQNILLQLRQKASVEEFPSVSSGYLSELEKMEKEMLEFLAKHPSQLTSKTA